MYVIKYEKKEWQLATKPLKMYFQWEGKFGYMGCDSTEQKA
jgi:hypothetical protein